MNNLTRTFVGAIIYLILATATSPCSREEHSSSAVSKLEFVGRVKDDLGVFLNDRIVILYLNGREVGRDVTKTGKYYTDNNPNDGLFQIIIPNQYELSEKEIAERGYSTGVLSTFKRGKKGYLGAATFILVGAGYEGEKYEFTFPTRNDLKYTVKIIYGDFGTVSRDIRECEGATYLTDLDEVVCPLGLDGTPGDPTEGEIEEIMLKEVEIPVDNCYGDTQISQNYTGSEKFVHEINFSMGVSTGLLKKVQAKFGFVDKEESYQSIETNFTAKARNRMVYKITWYEVWQYGTIPITTERETKNIPFKVKTKLKYKISSENIPCN